MSTIASPSPSESTSNNDENFQAEPTGKPIFYEIKSDEIVFKDDRKYLRITEPLINIVKKLTEENETTSKVRLQSSPLSSTSTATSTTTSASTSNNASQESNTAQEHMTYEQYFSELTDRNKIDATQKFLPDYMFKYVKQLWFHNQEASIKLWTLERSKDQIINDLEQICRSARAGAVKATKRRASTQDDSPVVQQKAKKL